MSSTMDTTPHSRLAGLLIFFGIPAMLLTFSALNVLEADGNSFIAAEKEFQLTGLMRKLTAPAKDGKPLDMSRIYLVAETATVANADLQNLLGRSIATASGRIIETSTLEAGADPEDFAARRVGIKATFDISNEGLLTLLHGLETGLPLVFVDKLSIRRLPADDAEEAATLRVDLEAAAQWRATGP